MTSSSPAMRLVLVPVEPTCEMLNAAIDVDSFKLGDISPLGFRISPQMLFERCFAAMLQAAPPVPSELKERLARVIDPVGWGEHDRLTMPIQPHEEGRIPPGAKDYWARRAADSVRDSLAKADAILSELGRAG